MATAIRSTTQRIEAEVIVLDQSVWQKANERSLRRLLFIVQNTVKGVRGELLHTDEGDPFLSIPLGGWAAIMVTPEADRSGTYGMTIHQDSGELLAMTSHRSFEATMEFVRAYLATNSSLK